MKQKNKHYWFKAKRYGFGWYPASWQAWVVLLIYGIIFGILIWIFETNIKKYQNFYGISVFTITGLLVYISYKKGEPARWRWG
jgi:hypothetical protein